MPDKVSPSHARMSEGHQLIAPSVEIINDPHQTVSDFLSRISGTQRRGRIVVCLGSTRTSDVPGVSAAGFTPLSCRQTPTFDAVTLVLDRPVSLTNIPVSPAGIVSPVVITRACARLIDWDIKLVNCGVFQPPEIDLIIAGERVADCVSTGAALPRQDVKALIARGQELGKIFAENCDYLILAECVPGGTTTAQAVLTMLGYEVAGLVSGSAVEPNQSLKNGLIAQGMARVSEDQKEKGRVFGPIEAMSAMGDPMQPCAVGIALSAAKSIPVMLAGGSQMLAVYALIEASLQDPKTDPRSRLKQRQNTLVGTTKWIVNDKWADTKKLANVLAAPCAFVGIDFSRSRHRGLRAYEQGHVKEGVGAGAALLIAALSGRFSETDIIAAIDDSCDELGLA